MHVLTTGVVMEIATAALAAAPHLPEAAACTCAERRLPSLDDDAFWRGQPAAP